MGRDNLLEYIKLILNSKLNKLESQLEGYANFVHNTRQRLSCLGHVDKNMFKSMKDTVDIDFFDSNALKGFGK